MFEPNNSVPDCTKPPSLKSWVAQGLGAGQKGPPVMRKLNVNKLWKSCPCQPWRKFSYLFVTCSNEENFTEIFSLNTTVKLP
jgi:hypothetical protein